MGAPGKFVQMKKHLLAWILIAAFGVTGLLTLNNTMYHTPDSANYLGWARSLASFKGYKLTYGPEPIRYVVNAQLYPLLLVPVAWLFPLNVIAAKVFTLGLGLLLLILFYKHVKARTGVQAAIMGVVLLVVNPQILLFSTQVLSDVPFAACMILVFMVVRRMVDHDSPAWTLWSLLALLSAGVLLRDIGFALLLAVAVFLALRKDYARAGFVLLAPMLVYLLWYMRNEVFIANVEFPELRNTKLFFSHVLTGEGQSLLVEFGTRILNNFGTYALPFGGLLLIPQYVGWVFGVVNYNDSLLAAIQSRIDALELPIVLLTLLVVGFGLYRLWTAESGGRLTIIFLVFYGAIILTYPTTDDRYLFPVLVIMAECAALSLKRLLEWIRTRSPGHQPTLTIALAGCIALLLVPNIGWMRNFISTAIEYRDSPKRLYAGIKDQARYPIEYTRWLPQAGSWISAKSIPSTVVISRYKEVGIWLDGRKVLTVGPLVSPEEFEASVRDYRGTYVVASMMEHQLHDFEFQMAVSRRFWFEPVYRAGDVEVLQVHRRDDSRGLREDSQSDSIDAGGVLRRHFLRGVRSIGSGNYVEARSTFQQLRNVEGFEAPATFYEGVASEFSGQLNDANELFRQLGLLPQAGSLLSQARAHQDIIRFLDTASTTGSMTDRASLYHTVSLTYWLWGFRQQAEATVKKCMEADSTYFVGPVFAALYALQRGDVTSASMFVARAGQLRPQDPLVGSLKEITTLAAALDRTTTPEEKASLRVNIGRGFMSIGLSDFAAEEFIRAMDLDSTNAEALEQLSDIYILKHRMYPASVTLSRLLKIEPTNALAQKKLAGILVNMEE